MWSPDDDLQFTRAAIQEMESYLISDVLYWPISTRKRSVGVGEQQLSIGTLLLCLARLRGAIKDQKVLSELPTIESQIDQIRQKWQANWLRKARLEFPQRLRLWQNALADASSDLAAFSSGYPRSVRWRVMMDLMAEDMAQPPGQEMNALARLDQQLKAITSPGKFVWDARLAPGFPIEHYWYLFVTVFQPGGQR